MPKIQRTFKIYKGKIFERVFQFSAITPIHPNLAKKLFENKKIEKRT
jgi:hypothetical protein